MILGPGEGTPGAYPDQDYPALRPPQSRHIAGRHQLGEYDAGGDVCADGVGSVGSLDAQAAFRYMSMCIEV